MNINGKAVVILIDNSPSSIDGDFYPNRLEAQKIAIERLSIYLFSICSYSQVALITMSPDEPGTRSSFTTMSNKISSVLRNIHSTSPILKSSSSLKPFCPLLLEKSLKTALVTIDHFNYQNPNSGDLIDTMPNKENNNNNETNSIPHIEKQIIAFICSKHDVDSDQKVENIKKAAMSKDTTINIVAFGPDVNDKELLRKLTQSSNPNSKLPNSLNLSTPLNSDSPLRKKVTSNHPNKKIKPINSNNSNNNSLTSSPSSGEFLDISSSSDKILSDIVLSSRIGTGNIKPQIPVKALMKTNPDLFESVYDSLLAYKQQVGDKIETSVENQIQMLENCLYPTPKTPQRTNLKTPKSAAINTLLSQNLNSNSNQEQNKDCSKIKTENNRNNDESDSNMNSSSTLEQNE